MTMAKLSDYDLDEFIAGGQWRCTVEELQAATERLLREKRSAEQGKTDALRATAEITPRDVDANRYHQSLGAKWMCEAIVREMKTTFAQNANAREFGHHIARKWEDTGYWRPGPGGDASAQATVEGARPREEPCKCGTWRLKDWWDSVTDAGNTGTDYMRHTRESCLTRTERDAARQPHLQEWADRDDEWTEEIKAAHPTRSGSHAEYGTAMRMIGNRHSKSALVELVNWMLLRLTSGAAPSGTGSPGFTGIGPPKAFETLDDRLVRILRAFKRPAVPFDLLSRIAEEPEDVVRPALMRLEGRGVVRMQDQMVSLLLK